MEIEYLIVLQCGTLLPEGAREFKGIPGVDSSSLLMVLFWTSMEHSLTTPLTKQLLHDNSSQNKCAYIINSIVSFHGRVRRHLRSNIVLWSWWSHSHSCKKQPIRMRLVELTLTVSLPNFTGAAALTWKVSPASLRPTNCPAGQPRPTEGQFYWDLCNTLLFRPALWFWTWYRLKYTEVMFHRKERRTSQGDPHFNQKNSGDRVRAKRQALHN